MSAEISRPRMIASTLAVALFAIGVYYAVQWRSQPPPPPEANKALLEKIEAGK